MAQLHPDPGTPPWALGGRSQSGWKGGGQPLGDGKVQTKVTHLTSPGVSRGLSVYSTEMHVL